MNTELLRDDCSRCAALCCVALAFDKSELFAFDKPAGLPCRHLDARGLCIVHGRRATSGLDGCRRFSCNGAGQRVVQECFHGESWQSNPDLKAPMLQAFQLARTVHDLLLLLAEALKLPLTDAQRRQVRDMVSVLTPDGAMTRAWLEATGLPSLRADTHRLLRSLRPTTEVPGQSDGNGRAA